MLDSLNGDGNDKVVITKDIDRETRCKDDHYLVELNNEPYTVGVNNSKVIVSPIKPDDINAIADLCIDTINEEQLNIRSSDAKPLEY